MRKERLDTLVQRQAGVTRSQAQGLIHTGKVYSHDGKKLSKPGDRLADDTVLVIEEGPQYVSRGGEKLESALREFKISVEGVTAIDVGASTGGFTDCLLQRGAARVYAVDVGYGQLAWKLRQDPRVILLERTNIRHLTPEMLGVRPDFFTVDCSFISLRVVLPPLRRLLSDEPAGVVLIKPQFEVGKDEVGKGGVVRDSQLHHDAIEAVMGLAKELGFTQSAVMPSPLLGPAGNQEYLAYLKVR